MIPHERSLVEKFKNRPFALIGVNSDNTTRPKGLEMYRKKAEEMGVTWRSFQNESISPQISDSWRVNSWPTLFYIDHDGVIRHKNVRNEAKMEEVLEEMIVAAERAAQ